MTELESTYRFHQIGLHADVCFQSNPKAWLSNAHYKKIVKMGLPVVPLILADLRKYLVTKDPKHYPGWWVMYALPEITGVKVPVGNVEVKLEDGFAKVSVDDVSRWWIDWAQKNEGLWKSPESK